MINISLSSCKIYTQDKKSQHGQNVVKIDWLWINKGERVKAIQYIPPPSYLFNQYTEYILRETGLEEDEHGFKSEGNNINNLHSTVYKAQ